MKKHLVPTLSGLVGVAIMASLAVRPASAGPFADVPFDHWAYEAIRELSDAGILEGFPDGTYRGQQPMTRYEFAVAISRIM
ncbi:MAG: S-layer protein, partial [Armatimonadetes bacterium CG_4_9_14_3_um_filter_58_7]